MLCVDKEDSNVDELIMNFLMNLNSKCYFRHEVLN